jgi:hypothetical protein
MLRFPHTRKKQQGLPLSMATAMLSPSTELLSGETAITLLKPTAAIQLIREGHGRSGCGLCLHLPRGARIEICGEGFSARTVQVRCDGRSYFVLLSSILA